MFTAVRQNDLITTPKKFLISFKLSHHLITTLKFIIGAMNFHAGFTKERVDETIQRLRHLLVVTRYS